MKQNKRQRANKKTPPDNEEKSQDTHGDAPSTHTPPNKTAEYPDDQTPPT